MPLLGSHYDCTNVHTYMCAWASSGQSCGLCPGWGRVRSGHRIRLRNRRSGFESRQGINFFRESIAKDITTVSESEDRGFDYLRGEQALYIAMLLLVT
jgi:hypothetical protein